MPLTVRVLDSTKHHEVFELQDDEASYSPVIYFKDTMHICADGAPNAYHPKDKPGLDDLANAGHPGDWWALVTDNGESDGTPLSQGIGDPYPGFYYSMTAMSNPKKEPIDPGCFVDARIIPYVVLEAPHFQGAKLGDLCVALNTTNGLFAGAMFAEVGDSNGEGSIALAKKLGIDPDPRTGGEDNRVIAYFVFKSTSHGWREDADGIQADAMNELSKRGGIARFQEVVAKHP